MSIAHHSSRRATLAAICACAVGLWIKYAAAQTIDVPLRLQAELLSKVAAYDRAFEARAKDRALVFVLVKANDAASEHVAAQILAELKVLREIGGVRHVEESVQYSSAEALAALVKARSPAIVYLSAGFADQMERIASALAGLSVLSVGASASYVARGVVLGFDVESGKPKLVVHLPRARSQHVAFRPELLKLARVVQ